MDKLQHVVFPNNEFRTHADLFYRSHMTFRQNTDGNIETRRCLAFNTYMNAFAADKWSKYTKIANFAVFLKFSGKGSLYIYNSFIRSSVVLEKELILEKEIQSDGARHEMIPIPVSKDQSLIHFEIEFDEKTDFILLDAYFGAGDSVEKKEVKIAIVICTFKREQYVNRNLDIMNSYFKSQPEIKQAFDCFIVDNGRTLPPDFEHDNIRIFPNNNTGGAGGFTRGIIEALRSEKEYTHVLLMDDDVEIFTESLFRTYKIVQHAREEYATAFIHGSMMKMNEKNVLFETLAYLHELWVRPWHNHLDVSQYSNVILNNRIPDHIFENSAANDKFVDSAWWYCCIPLTKIDLNNLPLPFFIRGDDVEYSLRFRGIHHININGVCIWHEPFDFRINKVMEVFLISRNMPIINMLYNEKFQKHFVIYYLKLFFKLLSAYDYYGIEMMIKALQTVLKGPDFFHQDQFQVIMDVKSVDEKLFPIEDKRLVENALNHQAPNSRLKKLLHLVTIAGLLLPKRFFRKEGLCLYGIYPPTHYFLFYRKMFLVNVHNNTFTIRELDKSKMLILGFRLAKLLLKFRMKYGPLKSLYQSAAMELKTIGFWDKYLNLN